MAEVAEGLEEVLEMAEKVEGGGVPGVSLIEPVTLASSATLRRLLGGGGRGPQPVNVATSG